MPGGQGSVVTGSSSISYSAQANAGPSRTAHITFAAPQTSEQFSVPVTQGTPSLQFIPVPPCRVADTRNANGPFGGPALAAGSTRSFAVPQSACGIPNSAQAYSLNVTVVPPGPLSYLTLWPAGQPQPYVSTLNSTHGEVLANAALVPAGAGGAVSVFVTDPTDVIVDINGYFDTPSATTLAFYAATPCRVADTRSADGAFGGPSLAEGGSRDFAIPASPCAIPSGAGAYSLNATVVPDGMLGYLTAWPTGAQRPLVSTLNSWTGKIVANAAIVPAGTNDAVSVFASNDTDAVLDINGYFALAGGAGALSFYPVTPCRIADTRNANGPLGGPILEEGETRSFAIPNSSCNIPNTAAAYALNITVEPAGNLGYLTVWPTGVAQPLVSTLNSMDGAVVANAAIVPASAADGSVSVFVSNRTHVILDINGYFAP
jgi:serine protease